MSGAVRASQPASSIARVNRRYEGWDVTMLPPARSPCRSRQPAYIIRTCPAPVATSTCSSRTPSFSASSAISRSFGPAAFVA